MPPPSAHLSYDNEESTPMKWVLIFVLLSLLLHAIIILAIILASIFIPAPKLDVPPAAAPTVSLSLQPAPPPAQTQPKHIFMPTKPQANAPHKDTLVESDNDTQLTSQSKKSRADNSIMPDVVSKTTIRPNWKTPRTFKPSPLHRRLPPRRRLSRKISPRSNKILRSNRPLRLRSPIRPSRLLCLQNPPRPSRQLLK